MVLVLDTRGNITAKYGPNLLLLDFFTNAKSVKLTQLDTMPAL